MPLPKTADELCIVACSVGADFRDIHIGHGATETVIEDLSEQGTLAQFKVVHFATHGGVAGDLRAAGSPD
jgi:CHAT domain-containing protein